MIGAAHLFLLGLELGAQRLSVKLQLVRCYRLGLVKLTRSYHRSAGFLGVHLQIVARPTQRTCR